MTHPIPSPELVLEWFLEATDLPMNQWVTDVAARAVLTAVTWKKYDVPPEGLPAFAEEMAPLIAAALRAAADQVVPEFWHEDNDIYGETMQAVRENLLTIATKLEGGAQ